MFFSQKSKLKLIPANINEFTVGNSLSGHTQQGPPLLIRPPKFSATTINIFTLFSPLPVTKGHLSNVATVSWQVAWPY